MTHMLCRNKVTDFETWRDVFASHAAAHREAGLKLLHLWHATEDANNVFFLFEVQDVDKAMAFINAPAAADAGEDSGVLEGDYYYLESAVGY